MKSNHLSKLGDMAIANNGFYWILLYQSSSVSCRFLVSTVTRFVTTTPDFDGDIKSYEGFI